MLYNDSYGITRGTMKRILIILLLTISTFSFANKSALQWYKKGQKAFTNMEYYEAADLFKKAIHKNPYYKEAYAGAGKSYFNMGNFLESRKFYHKALFYDPDNINYMLKLAEIRIKLAHTPKEYLGAEYYLNKAYRKEPRNVHVLMAYGEYYYKLKKYEKALNFFEKAKRSKNHFLAYLKLAKIYLVWKNYEKANEYLMQAENLNSMDYRTTFEIAKFYLETKKIEKAKRYFELTIKFNPIFREGLFKIIEFYIKTEDYIEAIKKVNQLLKIEPENPILYYDLAICYEKLKRYEESINFLLAGQKYDFSDELLRIKAEEIAVRNLGVGHFLRKKLATHYLLKGRIAYEKNQIDLSILYYKRGLRINPKSLKFRQNLAQIYRERNWVDLFLKTLKAGLYAHDNNQNLKDLISLNQKFLWETLSYKHKIDQYNVQGTYPIILINKVIADYNTRHFRFEKEMKELLIQGLINRFSVNVKEIKSANSHYLKKKGTLLLRLHFYEDDRKIELKAELISVKTGNIFKKYLVRRYGNNRLINAILYLSNKISEHTLPFGKILHIDDDEAIINVGKLHRIKPKDRFIILKNKDAIDDYFSSNVFKQQFIIGEAEILKVDERIALVKLYKSNKVVFNLININDIVMVKKIDQKKKKKSN